MYQELFKLQESTFKVIANQKRLEILQLLRNEELSVSEMVEMLGVRQANLSQHLALLRQHRLVTTRRSGLNVYYRLADKRIAQSIKLIREFLATQHNMKPEVSRAMNGEAKAIYPVVRDVVCRMRLSASEAAAHSVYQDTTYYFCGTGCKRSFDGSPSTYIGDSKKST